jgi:hypothetical protein
MNISLVVSNIAASDLRGLEHIAVKLTSTGIDIAGATDRIIGTLLRGAAQGFAVDVYLANANGLHYVTLGSNTAVSPGDELEQIAGGKFQKKGTGTAVAVAWEPSGSNPSGGIIRAVIY